MDSKSDSGPEPAGEEPAGKGRDSDPDGHAVFEQSMRQFADGATALTAASIRMQMMMLEQARGMMDDFTRTFADLNQGDETDG